MEEKFELHGERNYFETDHLKRDITIHNIHYYRMMNHISIVYGECNNKSWECNNESRECNNETLPVRLHHTIYLLTYTS